MQSAAAGEVLVTAAAAGLVNGSGLQLRGLRAPAGVLKLYAPDA